MNGINRMSKYKLIYYLCLLFKRKLFMKKILIPALLGIAVCSFLSSCSEKFDVAAPYKNITTVFGLLDISDTAHYIRVEKAFLDQNKSAIVMSQVPDSLYYPESQIVVTVQAINNSFSPPTIANTYTLSRVDLNNEGYPKASGAFTNSPSYAYKFKANLDPSLSYRIRVQNLATGEIDSTDTRIIDSSSSVFNINAPYFDPSIVNNPFTSLTRLTSYVSVQGQAPSASAMFEGIIRVHWTDSNATAHTSTQHSADWNFDNSPVGTGSGGTYVNYTLKSAVANFYYFLRDNIGVAPAGVTRYLTKLDVLVYAGNSDLYKYQQIGLLLGTGITGLDSQPLFTNMKGNNVYGLFAARGEIGNYGYVYADVNTRDSILYSPGIQSIIKDLNIVDVKFQ